LETLFCGNVVEKQEIDDNAKAIQNLMKDLHPALKRNDQCYFFGLTQKLDFEVAFRNRYDVVVAEMSGARNLELQSWQRPSEAKRRPGPTIKVPPFPSLKSSYNSLK